MKSFTFLLSFFLIIACQKKTTPEMPKGDFDYLIGNWERTNEQEGKKHSKYGNDQRKTVIKE